MAQVTRSLIELDFIPAILAGHPPNATLWEFDQLCRLALQAIAARERAALADQCERDMEG